MTALQSLNMEQKQNTKLYIVTAFRSIQYIYSFISSSHTLSNFMDF